MDLFSFPPIAATLDAAYALLIGLASTLDPLAGSASAAVAVILVTLLVRTLLIPTGIAQAKAEQTRARIAPRLRDLQRRYKNDRERLQRETMRLYADERASPFAGCLPVLVQAPVVSVIYALFLHTTIAGHVNLLLTGQLLGVPLSASLISLLTTGTLTIGTGAVFTAVIVMIAAVAELTRRLLRPEPVPIEAAPGALAVRLTGAFHFSTAVIAIFVPLAAGIYLLVTVTWTLIQRLILRRIYPPHPQALPPG
jgi:YidC/Oxa1 family membrane protein insertase